MKDKSYTLPPARSTRGGDVCRRRARNSTTIRRDPTITNVVLLVIPTVIGVPTERHALQEGVWHYPEHPLTALRWQDARLWTVLAWP
jgi:hypothetical protein